jgi:hypothetical protein
MNMHESLKRKGLIVELEEQLEAATLRLKGIVGSIHDAMFSMDGTHLDTDGKAIRHFAGEYREVQEQAHKIRQRIEELRSQ